MPRDEAVAWESRILEAAGGKAYEAVLQLVRAIDLSPRFVVRNPSTGIGSVSFILGSRVRNEFVVPASLRGAEVRVGSVLFPPIDGHVDQSSVADLYAEGRNENARSTITALIHGAPRFVDLVSLLAILDEISEGDVPQWTVCREHPNCFRGVLFGNRTGLAPGEVGPIDETRMKLAW